VLLEVLCFSINAGSNFDSEADEVFGQGYPLSCTLAESSQDVLNLLSCAAARGREER